MHTFITFHNPSLLQNVADRYSGCRKTPPSIPEPPETDNSERYPLWFYDRMEQPAIRNMKERP